MVKLRRDSSSVMSTLFSPTSSTRTRGGRLHASTGARRLIQEKKAPDAGPPAQSAASPRTRLLVRANNRQFIVDATCSGACTARSW